ncbi:Astra associated protein 1 Asa1 [Coemansia sp. RSA 1813]|nr:Astra associated protein 1 Asa1 [Coemansia sp. RSA 1646]KAJ1770564.1 Astra associated protein 1 Asa1 [Coemansia sp. RSA 1843]KAJ2092984.1 Astra associated protein 1 Asa1 [Coemansia sp. RSA 986]KAJ2211186.1 Astra associated protein 1 Asa1 [Coemansia sp. RSA 487]KAJ2569093.1 Astra associated protein 1 Asa1 [Coemansia sp. RSA 1813]
MAQPDFVFRGHQAAVNSVRFFADDRFLVSGDQDGQLIVWNMLLKRQLASAPRAHKGPILAVRGVGVDTVISQGRDNKLCVWRLEAGEFKGELVLAKSVDVDAMSFCKFTAFSIGSKTWLVALSDAGSGDAFAYEVSGGKRFSFNIGHKTSSPSGPRQDPPMCMSLGSLPSSAKEKEACDNNMECLALYVGYESTLLQCFELCVSADACVAKHARSLATSHKEPIMSIDYDRGSRVLYTCAADNTICCVPVGGEDADNKTQHATLRNSGAAEIRCFSSPGLVAVAGWDYVAHLYSKELSHISDVAFHRAALTSIDLSTPGKDCPPHIKEPAARQRWSLRPQWLAVASRDTRISLWDVNTAIA